MINSNRVAKALLIIWPDIPNYCGILEQKIYQNALCSYSSPDATEQIIDRIIDTTVRKDILKNLSKEVERVISGLPPKREIILRHHYYERQKTVAEIVSELGISVRSFYRTLNSAIDQFAEKLDSMGVNEFTWSYIINHNQWVKNVYLEQTE